MQAVYGYIGYERGYLPLCEVAGTPQTQNMYMQCRTKVEDVGPTLYKCYTNVLCLMGMYTLSYPNKPKGRSCIIVEVVVFCSIVYNIISGMVLRDLSFETYKKCRLNW